MKEIPIILVEWDGQVLPFVTFFPEQEENYPNKITLLLDTGTSSSRLSNKFLKVGLDRGTVRTVHTTQRIIDQDGLYSRRLLYLDFEKDIEQVFIVSDIKTILEDLIKTMKFNIDGILGSDFLLAHNAVIDYKNRILKIS